MNSSIEITFISLVGIIVGSFLNVVIHRLPRKESIIYPSSHCPYCHSTIRWYDNIPILSYLILKGRCRHCQSKISIKYPVIECLNALLWVLSYTIFGLSIVFLITIIIVSVGIVISMIDIETMTIPNQLVMILFLCGIALAISPSQVDFRYLRIDLWSRFIGFMIGGMIYFSVIISYKFANRQSLGLGDAKLIAAAGVILGWQFLVIGILFASIFGLVIEIPSRLLKNKRFDQALPFGPYLIIGFLIMHFWGIQILSWYYINIIS